MPDNFPGVNLEDIHLYDMYEDDTTYLDGSLAGKIEYDETPVMTTILDREVPMPEVKKIM